MVRGGDGTRRFDAVKLETLNTAQPRQQLIGLDSPHDMVPGMQSNVRIACLHHLGYRVRELQFIQGRYAICAIQDNVPSGAVRKRHHDGRISQDALRAQLFAEGQCALDVVFFVEDQAAEWKDAKDWKT